MNRVDYRFKLITGKIEEGEATTVEQAILRFRKRLKSTPKTHRAQSGSLEYRIDRGDWITVE